jgi:hypothetical protein
MKGFKKQKKPTAAQALQRADELELKVAMYRLDIRERTAAFLLRTEVLEGMFKSALSTAATLTEAQRWFDTWTRDLNAIPLDHPNHDAEVQAIIERHGFSFRLADNHQIVDKIWEGNT